MFIQRMLRAALLLSTVSFAAFLTAQTAASALHSASPEPDYPEQAYLSASHYVNQFFGLGFELPYEAHLHPVSEQASRDGRIPLLNLQGPPPADALILLTAIPSGGLKGDDAKLLLRESLDQELYRGVEELHGLTKANFAGHQFYFYETRQGIDQHMILATTLGEYILRVALGAHDEKVLKHMEDAFHHVEFFAPAATRAHLDADAKPSEGPSMSSHRLALLARDPPANHIDQGNVSGDFYENAMLGFSYRIPQGWSIEPQGAIQPAIERYRAKENFGRPRMGRVERQLVENCSRTLFSAWAKRPGPDGQISYDDFGEVTVSAMSAACFPRMKFPQDPNDQQTSKDFIAQYALTHPIVQDMRDAKVFTQDGMTFVFLEGTVAFQVPDDALSRRLSLGMAITQRRGYLLTWFFAAPHDEELRALTNERATFDRGSNVTLATATQPGGGSSRETVPSTAAASGSPAQPGAPASQQDATHSGQAEQPANTTPAAQSSAASKPSLLRPGEAVESQPGKGTPIRKK